jgi:tetratricopeptide (TPR) repeat protein
MPLFNSFNHLIVDNIAASVLSFNNYLKLNAPINERALFNTLEYLKLLNSKYSDEKEKLVKIIAALEFQSQGLKQVFEMLHPTEELKKLGQDEIRAILQSIKAEIPVTNDSLRCYVAIACYSWGYTDEVLSYLEGNEILSRPCPESVFYCKAVFYGDGDKLKLLDLLRDYRAEAHGYFDLYAIELTLRQTLKDYAGIIEACKTALHHFPTNEKIIYTLLHTYDQNVCLQTNLNFHS